MDQRNAGTWQVIINPVSGGRKAPKLWKKIQPVLQVAGISFTEYFTEKKNHATEITRQCLTAGAQHILIIGGDGTANEVINGIFSIAQNTPSVTLAMISAGTGNDWVRSIGSYKNTESIARSMADPQTFLHDTGMVEYEKNAHREKRYFINITGLGFDGFTAKQVAEGSRRLQGTKLQYWIALFKSILSYKHTVVQFTVDGKQTTMNTLSVAAGVCKYNGGGMMQLPMASFNDGLLDMTVIGSMSKLKMVMSLPKLIDGSFINMKEIALMQGKEMIITSDKKIYVEADGEYLGQTPARITIIPHSLQILQWQ